MRYALTVCLALLSAPILGASMDYSDGPELFSPLPAGQLKHMSPLQRQRIDRIQSRPTTAFMSVVHAHADALMRDGARLWLPGAKTFRYSTNKVETRGADDFTWFGALSGAPEATFIVVVRDGNITGTIRVDGELYRIEPLGDGLHALVRVDESRFPPMESPEFLERATRGETVLTLATASDTKGSDTPVGIDVLVAYTSEARAAVSDILALIRLAVAETNQSYQNSGVNIRLSLADSFELSYSESGKTFNSVMDDFQRMPEVHARRTRSGADIAVVVSARSDGCGVATTIMANASNAFAGLYHECVVGYYGLAHELGHLQGAMHDPAHDWNTTPFAYGHGFQHPSPAPSFRTIMAYDCPGGCPLVPYWSNPNVHYMGVPMGTADISHDARVLNETARTVAGFRAPRRSPLLNYLGIW